MKKTFSIQYTAFLLVFLCFSLFYSKISAQDFQRCFGTSLDNAFTKVIRDGAFYYVLGQEEITDGAQPVATVTRLDANGSFQWTIRATVPSVFNDAVRLSNGDLMVVGHTLPFDANSKSLIGKVASQFGGNFSWLRSYDVPGRDGFTRIVWNPLPENPQFNLYVLGTQNQSGGSPTADDVVLLNLDANANFNFKKIYASAADDEFGLELDVLNNGDMVLAGNNGQGVIYQIDHSGNQFTGISIAGYTFLDVIEESPTIRYAVANESTGDVHVLKMDQDWLLQWDIGIPDLLTVSQIWSDGQGQLFVTGTGNFNGSIRPVVAKLLDNNPIDVSIKYLFTGSSFIDGSTWLMPNGQLAYSDARIIPGQFGQHEAFISLSDTDLTTCAVTEETHDIVFFDPVPNGPVGPVANIIDVINGTEFMHDNTTWQEADVCGATPCGAFFTFTHNTCGSYSFTGQGTGISPFSFAWNFGNPASGTNNTSTFQNPVHQFTASGLFTVVLTVTDGTGCVATWTVFINVPTLPAVTINANPGLSICQGQTSILTANSGAGSTYVWNNTNTTQSILVGGADTYCVTITDINGCTATDCVNVIINPLPSVAITGNLSICTGSSTTLTATGGGIYLWSPSGATTASITVNPSVATNYSVLVTLNGCTNNASATVSILPLPVAFADVDQTICRGSSVSLTGSATGGTPPYTFSWNPGNLLGSVVSTGNLQNTTTYTLQVTDANGCSGTDQEIVIVKPLPVVNAGPDITICPGDFANLIASASGGTPTYLYTWNHWWQLNPYAVSPGLDQTYTVVVTDANGCSASDQMDVELKDCCHSSLIDNPDFSGGSGTYGYDGILYANSWSGIWDDGPGTNRTGDYWDLQGFPSSPIASLLPMTPSCYGNDPIPPSQGKYAGFMCHYGPGSIGRIYRQGIMNDFSSQQAITPNSGFYKVSINIACPCLKFGSPKLAVYGVRTGKVSSIPLLIGPSSLLPSNGNLFGTPGNPGAKELGTIIVPNTQCDDEFDTYFFVFNSSILSGPIDRIFFTRKDVTAGSAYLAVDDVCVEKVDDAVGNYCDCGPPASAFIYQQGNNVYRQVRCGQTLNLPCRKTSYNTNVQVNFPCSSISCPTNNIVTWALSGPAGSYSGTGSVTTYSNIFSFNLLPGYFASTGGTYTLSFSRQCGSQTCKCTIILKLAACPCICDDDYRLSVNQGFAVTGPSTGGACSRILKPLALCPNDVVTWYVAGGGTYGPTYGNDPQSIPFTSPGSYTVCMSVTRWVNGVACETREHCRNVNVSCGNDPNGTIYKSCTQNKLKNGDFIDTTMVSGLLGEFANLSDWALAYNFGDGQVIVDDTTGADDPGHIILVGGSENIAGIAQEITLDSSTELTLAYSIKNYSGAATPVGTKLVIRLQSHYFPDAEFQIIYEQEIDSSLGDWMRNELTLSIIPDSSLPYIVFSLENADTSQRSTIGLDNIEACTDETVSTSHISLESLLHIYPNPATTSLYVDLSTLKSNNLSLQIVKVTGEIIMDKETAGKSNLMLDISKFGPGIYFVRLHSGNQLLNVTRFVKL